MIERLREAFYVLIARREPTDRERLDWLDKNAWFTGEGVQPRVCHVVFDGRPDHAVLLKVRSASLDDVRSPQQHVLVDRETVEAVCAEIHDVLLAFLRGVERDDVPRKAAPQEHLRVDHGHAGRHAEFPGHVLVPICVGVQEDEELG